MSFIWNFSIFVVALVVVLISKWWYQWSNPKCNGKLPPGSMGFPIVGETIDFFESFGFYEISPFVKKRMLRYGPMFRTNIFGSNTVVITNPDVIFEVFRQENKSFIIGYPDVFYKVFGKGNLLPDKNAKQTSLQFIGSESLKRKLIGDMDRVTHNHIESMASQGSFNVKEAVANSIIKVLTPKMISNLKPETEKILIECFKTFSLDWFQSFLNLSTWRSFYKVYVGRKAALQVINDVFLKRKESKENHEDFLGTMLQNSMFNEKSIVNNIFGLSVLAKNSTSLVTSFVVKFIAENPKVLSQLKREHEVILQDRCDKESGITWEEYKNKMTFTNMVINESLRLVNPTPAMFRKVVQDIEIEGYLIPAGWIVVVAPSVIHFDPIIYEKPLEFNPWRWEGKDLLNGSKTFMVFGGGVRLCPGAAFARLQIAIFIHHLVTKYDFDLAQHCEVTRKPFPFLPNGFKINISHHSPTKCL